VHNTRLSFIVQFLFGLGMLVAAALMIRVHRLEANDVLPGINPDTAGTIYHDRMEATETMLANGVLQERTY